MPGPTKISDYRDFNHKSVNLGIFYFNASNMYLLTNFSKLWGETHLKTSSSLIKCYYSMKYYLWQYFATWISLQGVREFYGKVKDQQRKYHPVVLDGLSKVLMSFGMTREVYLKLEG